jgi:hypothetical protein
MARINIGYEPTSVANVAKSTPQLGCAHWDWNLDEPERFEPPEPEESDSWTCPAVVPDATQPGAEEECPWTR